MTRIRADNKDEVKLHICVHQRNPRSISVFYFRLLCAFAPLRETLSSNHEDSRKGAKTQRKQLVKWFKVRTAARRFDHVLGCASPLNEYSLNISIQDFSGPQIGDEVEDEGGAQDEL